MSAEARWMCRACGHVNMEEDGPVCENCEVDARSVEGRGGSGERVDAIPDAACEAYLHAATGPPGDATVFERVRRGLAAALRAAHPDAERAPQAVCDACENTGIDRREGIPCGCGYQAERAPQTFVCDRCGDRLPGDVTIEHYCDRPEQPPPDAERERLELVARYHGAKAGQAGMKAERDEARADRERLRETERLRAFREFMAAFNEWERQREVETFGEFMGRCFPALRSAHPDAERAPQEDREQAAGETPKPEDDIIVRWECEMCGWSVAEESSAGEGQPCEAWMLDDEAGEHGATVKVRYRRIRPEQPPPDALGGQPPSEPED